MPAHPHPFAIAVHGGAGIITRNRATPEGERAALDGLAAALEAGAVLLRAGGAALDAVEAAVAALEDDPLFNAGCGAVFTAEGAIELDAAIMDGATGGCGAVASVTRTRNPVALARRVMDASPHVLLAGGGADAFALAQGVAQCDPAYFETPERRRQYDEFRAHGGFDRAVKYGTVGAVARDRAGRLAAATSTGGLTGKRWGRLGDTPIVGAGTWADARVAVSCTGSGEDFLRTAFAHAVAARVRHLGEAPGDAAAAVVAGDLTATGGSGGAIVLGVSGAPAWAFNSEGMHRARLLEGNAPEIAIYAEPAR